MMGAVFVPLRLFFSGLLKQVRVRANWSSEGQLGSEIMHQAIS